MKRNSKVNGLPVSVCSEEEFAQVLGCLVRKFRVKSSCTVAGIQSNIFVVFSTES